MTDNLEELERLLAKATPGPWRGYSEPDVNLPYSLFAGTPMVSGFEPIEPLSPCDIDLIVALRNAAPSLIATAREVEGLRKQLAETADLAFAAQQDSIRLASEVEELRAALSEAIDVFDGMCDDEIEEELLPRLRAALGEAK